MSDARYTVSYTSALVNGGGGSATYTTIEDATTFMVGMLGYGWECEIERREVPRFG